ncbi:MAG: kinase [Rikenellaceae bacterium]
MERYKGYTCVTLDELTSKDTGPAVMSGPNYKQLVARKRINVMRQGKGLDNYALIDFHSLPERFKVAFIAKYGNPDDVIKSQQKGDAVLEDTAARDFYDKYRLADGSSLDDDRIDSYTMTASILNEVIKRVNETKSHLRSQGGNGGITQKEETISLIEDFRLYPGHSLPTSWARLSAKIRDYKKRGYEALIEGYLGNTNTVKITDEMGRHIIALKRSKVPQYNNEQIFTEINRIAPEKGWKPIKSQNTITAFLNRPDIKPLWYDAKLGTKAAKYKYNRKHKTIMPTMRDELWYGDGTKLNLYYKAWNEKAHKWKLCTTSVYEVIDASSEMMLGYCISDSENFDAQYLAYRNAIETSGCRPFEIVYDNQGGQKSGKAQEFFDKIARVDRATAPYNAQSKSIESVFGRFQKQVLARDWRFTGMNITARGEFSRVDDEFIEANKQDLYTLEELRVAYALCREQWNAMIHHASKEDRLQSRKEMYLSSINPETQPITQTDLINIFWVQSEKEITFTSSGLTITIDKKEYTYDVYGADGLPDLHFRDKHTYRKFTVKYDPMDMTKVRLYTTDSRGALKFITEAAPYREVHRALQSQVDGDMEFIRQVDEAQKQHMAERYVAIAQLEMEHGVAPEQHGLNRPRISGIPAKSLERFMDGVMVQGTEQPIGVGPINKALSNVTQDQDYSKF